MAKINIHLDKKNENWLSSKGLGKGKKEDKEKDKGKGKKATLRQAVIRLAHENPDLREHLLPILKNS